MSEVWGEGASVVSPSGSLKVLRALLPPVSCSLESSACSPSVVSSGSSFFVCSGDSSIRSGSCVYCATSVSARKVTVLEE